MTSTPSSAPAASERRPVPSDAKTATFGTRFVDLWWVNIPAKLRAYSSLLWAVWSDGMYLTAWPRVATLLVFAVFLFGFVEGNTHWSYRTIVGSNGISGNVLAPSASADNWGGPTRLVFAENLPLLMIAVGMGSLSANLGLTLVLGYALGDIFFLGSRPSNFRYHDVIAIWIYQHIPLLASYLLFFLLASICIVMAKDLVRSLPVRMRDSLIPAIPLIAFVQGVLIYCWGCMAPMVFRTAWAWSGGEPRIQVLFYSNVIATWLIPVGVIAVIVRAVLAFFALREVRMIERLQASASLSWLAQDRIPAWIRGLFAAGVVTLLITGILDLQKDWADAALFSNFLEAYIVFIGLTAAFLVWIYVLPRIRSWQNWTSRVEQYPAVLRLAAATVISYVVCLIIIAIPGAQSTARGEFGPEVTAILVGLGLTLVLLPHGWFGFSPAERVLPRLRLPRPSPSTRAVVLVFFVLLVTKKIFGDCDDYHCCLSGLPRVGAAAGAGTVPGIGGLAGGLAAGLGAGIGAGLKGGVGGNKNGGQTASGTGTGPGPGAQHPPGTGWHYGRTLSEDFKINVRTVLSVGLYHPAGAPTYGYYDSNGNFQPLPVPPAPPGPLGNIGTVQ